MQLLLLSLSVLIAGGAAGLMLYRSERLSSSVAAGSAVAASILGMVPAIRALAGGRTEALRLPWSMPLGSFSIGLDAISAFFLVPVLFLAAMGAIYGTSSMRGAREPRRTATSWIFYNVLVASMILAVIARNGMLFLITWEAMAVASFLLVMFDDEKPSVRRAGWIYLVATHIGTAFLLVMFLLLGRGSGSLDFEVLRAGPGAAGLVFLLAVIGFGTKAGFVPMHIWLPEAHPAAPSHVSAIMSGVMIKMGIYGLIRILTMLGAPPPWWGWVLLGIGAVSGVLGVLFALAQHDLKRLLAYHSVENIGIITLGIGVGLLGRSYGHPLVAAFGFGGALIHVLNHALFKGLLFMAAGAVVHATHTRDIDHLGGMLKRMPWTGASFLIGSVAICGLPPLNGFISEFLIYVGAFSAVGSASPAAVAAGILVVAALSLIGGLAVACFTKAFGIVFLGEPRSTHAAGAREVDLPMRVAMMALVAGCVAIGLFAPLILPLGTDLVRAVSGGSILETRAAVAGAGTLLRMVVLASAALVLGILVLALLRRGLLARKPVATAPTWDCGYAAPTARMQYTASSYAQPLTSLFGATLRTHRTLVKPEGLFPRAAAFETASPDVLHDEIYTPAFSSLRRLFSRFRWLQGGSIHLYILYIALTLLVLLIWKLR